MLEESASIKSLLISEQTYQNVYSKSEMLFDSIHNVSEIKFASSILIAKYLLWIYN